MSESLIIDPVNKWCAIVFASVCIDNLFEDKCDSVRSALLSIGGIPILDHWLGNLRKAGIRDIFVVGNGPSYPYLVEWALTRGLAASNILKGNHPNGEISRSSLMTIFQQNTSNELQRNLLIVRGNALLKYDFNLPSLLSGLPTDKDSVIYNDLSNLPLCTESNHISAFEISQWAADTDIPGTGYDPGVPLLSVYRSVTVPLIIEFMRSLKEHSNIPLRILNWLYQCKAPIHVCKLDKILAIDSADAYHAADAHFNASLADQVALLPPIVTHFCPARVGLMGNPSDGFGGKTLSFLIRNFNAQVTIKENLQEGYGGSCKSNDTNYRNVTLIPHPTLDPSSFGGMGCLQLHTAYKGYYGGIRLLQATCKSFSEHCIEAGILIHLQRGFMMSYDTDIPRMVGLSGSSAIVVAAFRALLEFYGLSLRDLNIDKCDFPRIILDIERVELEIACGLQDRVVQTYGGLVHMDFTGTGTGTGTGTSTNGVYTEQNATLIPPMYLAYNINAGGESGKVHSTVKTRWHEKDPSLVAGMRTLGALADTALECLERRDAKGLARLMEKNFAVRRELYGDGPVGALNISMVALAASLGLSAKFTGSGGALLCLQSNGEGWLMDAAEQEAVEAFGSHGFRFLRIEVA